MRGEGGKREEEDDMEGILRRYLWEKESSSVGNANLFTLQTTDAD